MKCKYCDDMGIMIEKEIPDIAMEQFVGYEKLQVIIDRGYLRLCYIDDCDCLDHDEKIKINYCPMCGKKL
jgi:hypothetical protein